VAKPASEMDAGQFLVLGQIGSITLRSVIADFMGFWILEFIHLPERPLSVNPRWIRRPWSILIVSADHVCGMCSSAPSLDDEAARSGLFWRDESRRRGLLCYAHGHFNWLLFSYVLVLLRSHPVKKLKS